MFERYLSRHSSPVRPSPDTLVDPHFEQVLDACLLDIQVHHKSLADCLKEYPSCADELRPLLMTALEVRAVPSVSPSAAFRQIVRRQLLEPPKGPAPHLARASPIISGLNSKRALYAISAITLIGFSVWGTVVASATSLPGNPLYPIKRWSESVELGFSNDPSSRILRHAELARHRLDEVKALASHGEDDLALQTFLDYENEINSAIEGLTADQQNRASDAARILREQLVGELAEMQQFQRQVPTSSIPVVKRAQTTMIRAIDQLDFPVPGGD